MYINDEHCMSLEQLKNYFSKPFTIESNLFNDLLEAGRHGEIAKWLRDIGEDIVAEQVEAINVKLSDTDYMNRLNLAITTHRSPVCSKPDFDKCFKIEDVKTEQEGHKIVVNVILKILTSVNEKYKITLLGGQKRQTEYIVPYNYVEGETCSIVYKVKQPELNKLGLYIDDKLQKVIELTAANHLFPISHAKWIVGVTSMFDFIERWKVEQYLKEGSILSFDVDGIEFVFDKKGKLESCKIKNGTQMPYEWSKYFSWYWANYFNKWVDVLHRKEFIIYEIIEPYKTSNDTWYGKILAQSPDYKYRICIVFDDSCYKYGPDNDRYKLRAKYIYIDLMPEARPRKRLLDKRYLTEVKLTRKVSMPDYLRSIGLDWGLSRNDCENLFLKNNYKIEPFDEGDGVAAIAPDKSVQFNLLFFNEELYAIYESLPE